MGKARMFKRMRQEARHEAQRIMGSSFEAVGKHMRKKPHWIPLWLWIIPFYAVFPKRVVGYVRHFYKQAQ